MKLYLDHITSFLGVQKPYALIFCDLKKVAADYTPVYTEKGRLKQHMLRICLEPDAMRGVRELIAHEFVHAWQEENGHAADNPCHNETFRYLAKSLRMYLKGAGYANLGKFYLKELDIT